MLFFTIIWFCLFLYLLYMELCKFIDMGVFVSFLKFLVFNFDHRSFQSSMFFKFIIFFLVIFWGCGLLFPLFSPWSCIGYLFFVTNFTWLGVRTYSLAVESFMVFFEGDHSWNWVSSLVMFFSHWLSFMMSSVALTLRISIIFLIGHFLMFSILGLGLTSSFSLLLFVIPIELFFAFLQSYIFLTLVCMFLLNMV